MTADGLQMYHLKTLYSHALTSAHTKICFTEKLQPQLFAVNTSIIVAQQSSRRSKFNKCGCQKSGFIAPMESVIV